MKFLLAIIAYLVIGLVLGWGILLAVKGEPWLLIVGVPDLRGGVCEAGLFAEEISLMRAVIQRVAEAKVSIARRRQRRHPARIGGAAGR